MAASVVNTHIHIHILNGRLEGGERAVDAAALARIRSPSERERERMLAIRTEISDRVGEPSVSPWFLLWCRHRIARPIVFFFLDEC